MPPVAPVMRTMGLRSIMHDSFARARVERSVRPVGLTLLCPPEELETARHTPGYPALSHERHGPLLRLDSIGQIAVLVEEKSQRVVAFAAGRVHADRPKAERQAGTRDPPERVVPADLVERGRCVGVANQ